MTVIGVPNTKSHFLDIGEMSRSRVLTQPVLILCIESPKNGRFYSRFWKPVDFGTQTVTDGLAHFHRIAQKWAIL
jgi:hypothetical protein